jgi:siderophore synthetase component
MRRVHILLSTITFNKHLTVEENNIYTYLHQKHPQLAETFLSYIGKSRQGIMKRLLQALLREGLIEKKRISWVDHSTYKEVFIHISTNIQVKAIVKRTFSLQQLEVSNVYLINEGVSHPLNHPVELLRVLEEGEVIVGYSNQSRFYKELENSSANYALALTAEEHRSVQFRKSYPDISNSIQWVMSQKKLNPSFSPLVFFEQWVIDGHTIHPCSKTKIGFNPEELMIYSPEWEGKPKITFVAVKRTQSRVTSFYALRAADLFYQDFPNLKQHVIDELEKHGGKEEEYDLIPVHPWQLNHTIPKLYQNAIENGEIIPISSYSIDTHALISVRTLSPIQSGKHHIKTAINVQATSAVRTVSPGSTVNGPVLSQLIKEMIQKDPLLSQVEIIEDKAGIYYSPSSGLDSEHDEFVLGRNLAAIVRENPEKDLKEGEIAMPAAALIANSPITNKPIVAEIIEAYAKHNHIPDIRRAAVDFFNKYASVFLKGVITLMSKYGIGLEAHLQNSVPVFCNGVPVKMKIRDFGGVRIVTDRLKKQGFSVNLSKNSMIVTHDVNELHQVISHAIIHNHLGELAVCIVRHFPVKEECLWKEIAVIIKNIYVELKKSQNLMNQVREDEQAFFKPTLDLKALVAMRLNDELNNCFASVPNPLANWKGELSI